MQEIQDTIEQIKQNEDFFQKAKLISYLQKEKKVTTKALSNYLEMKPAYVCHITRLNKLPELVIDGYYSKLISVSHLFIIARLKDQQKMLEVYEKVLGEGLTVIKTEELVREHLYNIKSEGEHIDKGDFDYVRAKLKQIDSDIDLKVVQTRVKAKIQIEIHGSLKKTSKIIKTLLDKLA
jgi:hypothetical protein